LQTAKSGNNGEIKAIVDDFIGLCWLPRAWMRTGKTASGKILLRVLPEVHAGYLIAAQAQGESLSQWALNLFCQALGAKRLACA
jgi:predicted HicB family RNase H-like nuclease